jgi:hypothetical protein
MLKILIVTLVAIIEALVEDEQRYVVNRRYSVNSYGRERLSKGQLLL